MGTALQLQADASEEDGEKILIREGPNDSTYKQRVFSEARYIVNDLLQEEIRRQSSSEKENLHTDPPFNIDVYLQDINLLLVHFITSATQTVCERLRSSLGTGHDTNRHVKKVRQYCASYSTAQIQSSQLPCTTF